jgi:hypothetical protein
VHSDNLSLPICGCATPGWTPWQRAKGASARGHEAIVKQLLEKGAVQLNKPSWCLAGLLLHILSKQTCRSCTSTMGGMEYSFSRGLEYGSDTEVAAKSPGNIAYPSLSEPVGPLWLLCAML